MQGPFGIFQDPFCRKTPKIEGETLWGNIFSEKESQCRKESKVGLFSLSRYGPALVGAMSKSQKQQKDFKMSKYWRIWNLFQKVFFFKKKTQNAEKKLRGGPFRIFQHPFCCKTPKKLKGDPLVEKNEKKSHSAQNNLKGGPFGLVRYCSVPWTNRGNL